MSVEQVPPQTLSKHADGLTSAQVSQRVLKARSLQKERFHAYGEQHTSLNHRADGALLEKICPLEDAARILLSQATERWKFSARSYHRVLRVSRTIADLEEQTIIQKHHLAEALSYREKIL